MAKAKVAFGGFTVCFAKCKDTIEDIMGSKPIPPGQLTKKLWEYIKAKKLTSK